VSGAAARHTISGGPRNRVNFSLVFQQATAEAPASPPQQPWDRLIREEFTKEYRSIVIDDPALYEEVRDYVASINPELADRVEYTGDDGNPGTNGETARAGATRDSRDGCCRLDAQRRDSGRRRVVILRIRAMTAVPVA